MAKKKKKLNGFQKKQQKIGRLNTQAEKHAVEVEDLLTRYITGSGFRRESMGVDRYNLKPGLMLMKGDNTSRIKVPYIPLIENLDQPIRSKVQNWIKDNPVYMEGCWWVASQLSLEFPDTEVVHGFYSCVISLDETIDHIEGLLPGLPKHKIEDYLMKIKVGHNGLIYRGNERGNGIYPIFRNSLTHFEVLTPHSWNYNNGVHFDVSGELLRKWWVNKKTFEDYVFMNYYQVAKTNLRDDEPTMQSLTNLNIRSWFRDRHNRHPEYQLNDSKNTFSIKPIGEVSSSISDDQYPKKGLLKGYVNETFRNESLLKNQTKNRDQQAVLI